MDWVYVAQNIHRKYNAYSQNFAADICEYGHEHNISVKREIS